MGYGQPGQKVLTPGPFVPRAEAGGQTGPLGFLGVTRLVLASASPGRLNTLRRAGVTPVVRPADVDEEAVLASLPDQPTGVADVAAMLARAKAEAVPVDDGAGALVLGCDSLLELDGRAHGKPTSRDAAVERWRAMRGRSGVLHTGHCLIDRRAGAAGEERSAVGSTTVHFADVTDEEIEAYADTGEPLSVAGAFTIDGYGGAFVTGIEGDHHNVVGLSLPVLRRLLADLGVAWHTLWE